MAISKEDVLEYISGLSVLELSALVKDFEEKHGSQLLLLIRFLMHARNSGVLKWKA